MLKQLTRYIKRFIISLLLLSGGAFVIYAQSKISGTINEYGRVTSLGTDYVIVADPVEFSKFKAGDTTLLVQMKGVKCIVPENANYGVFQTYDGTTGGYEFLTVQSVDGTGGINKIIFRNNIVKSYDVLSDVQIVKVPSYYSAVIDNVLTCAPWDSTRKTGGVLTMIVGTKLTLNANINAKGMGFYGGAAVEGSGTCIETDLAGLNKFSYPVSFTNSGFKGESHVSKAFVSPVEQYPIYPGYAKGYGANYTGGGGGNGRFSGGGGGSLFGAGGKGGLEQPGVCTIREPGGIGGKSARLNFINSGIFFGGGGGGSTHSPGATTSPGGRGGGIIIILCETLDGNGKIITADGETPVTASGDAGSGGGGAGGTIAIYLQSFTATSLVISAKGGNGGNNAGQFGEGGGGGGGLINISIPFPSAGNITSSAAGGIYGTRSGVGHEATSGATGDILNAFAPVLNGFLFNTIKSSVTLNQVDSICSNVIIKPITGTNPVGGTTYTYLWQKSFNLKLAPSNIPLSNTRDYTPATSESDTVYFRRIVTNNGNLLTDTSKWVEIRVHREIEKNIVGKDTIICYNQDPINLIPQPLLPLYGNGYYAYRWIKNNDNNWDAFTDATGANTSASYDPPRLTDTTFFKRIVTSGRCENYSVAVTITVLPLITGNITSKPDSVICEGTLFSKIGASVPGGGDGSYKFQWQDSTTSFTWQPATGLITDTIYTPDTSTFKIIERRFFRRVVFSGQDSVCRDNSRPVMMTRYHLIRNNSISADTTICSGITPPSLSGTTPINGDGTYTYSWQDMTRVTTWAQRGTAPFVFSPPALTDTTWYRRIVNSSECSDTSKVIVIRVHQPITNNIISLLSGPGPDTTLCQGGNPNMLKGKTAKGGKNILGDYAYQWFDSTSTSIWQPVLTAGTDSSYNPPALIKDTWYKRKVTSGKCSSFSDTPPLKVIILPSIVNNTISADPAVCYKSVPAPVSGSVLTGGAGGTPTWLWQESSDDVNWSTASGPNPSNSQSYSPPSLKTPRYYRRIIYSGPNNCCIDTSDIAKININPLPTGSITTGTDTTLCNGTKITLNIHLTGASSSPWKVVYNVVSNGVSNPVTIQKIVTQDTTIKVIPVATASKTEVTYSLFSVQDKNNCSDTTLSGSRKAIVYRYPVANAGRDTAVCGPQVKLKATRSDGDGVWYFPPQVVYSAANAPEVIVKIDSSFTEPKVTYKFYWEETNWQCVNKDMVEITFDRRIKPVNAGPDTTIYSFDNIIQLKATPLQTGETGSWSVVAGTGDFDDNTASSTDIRNVSMDLNTYKWSVINGTCKVEDKLDIDIKEIIIPQAFSPNDDPDNYNNIFIIRGLDLRKKWVSPDSVPAYQEADLSIVNGAGSLVFSTTTRDGNEWKHWDGKNSKGYDLPEGTYYYLLKLTSLGTGQLYKKSGFIILKRY
jgi:hypothetical protein